MCAGKLKHTGLKAIFANMGVVLKPYPEQANLCGDCGLLFVFRISWSAGRAAHTHSNTTHLACRRIGRY
jgi:hypothetical protein